MRTLIEIFRSGRHVAMSGEAHSFSDSDLDAIVSSYDPSVHEAPIVIGHPTDNAPAFGWVKSLSRKGARLEAGAEQIEPSFAEAVKAGRYKKVSASFYKPDSANNPKPGSFYLRHVGFLGAQPPAVKGLKDASFAGTVDDCITIDLAEGGDELGAIKEAMDAGTVLGRLRGWFIKMFGVENADEALPLDAIGGGSAASGGGASSTTSDAGAATNLAEPDAAKLSDELVKLLGDLVPADKADATKKAIEELLAKEIAAAAATTEDKTPPTPPAPPPANHAEHKTLTPREKAVAEREAAVAKQEIEQRRNAHASFVETLLREGRPMPAKKDAIVGLLLTLDAVPPKAVSFGEGEQRDAVTLLKDMLSRMPKQVAFEEVAGTQSFVDSDDPLVVAKAAEAYRDQQHAKGNHISTTDAVNHVKGTR